MGLTVQMRAVLDILFKHGDLKVPEIAAKARETAPPALGQQHAFPTVKIG
ncbi:hypothetical protein GCM10007385_29160 [Tateyamaria omphalii]|nr:hypothetical protein [Tateyamaria omphalii]GGX58564.1 hypothetical protein GCM10007385_29160 [Tateyamaria omphalii]